MMARFISLCGLVLVVLIVSVYFFYIRGVGVRPKLSPSVAVRIGKKSYTARWVVKKPMPTARSEVAVAAVDGKIVVIGGLDGFGRTLATVEAYDPMTDAWERLPDLPQPRHHPAAAVVDGILYVIGGMTGLSFTPQAEVYSYSPQAKEWISHALLPSPRGAAAASALNRKIYVIGGVGVGGATNELAVFDPGTDLWETKRPAPTKREHLAVVGLSDRLLVAAGRTGSLSSNLSLLEIYDPAADAWSQSTPLAVPRGGVAGATLENLFVVLGGEKLTGTFSDVDAYDIKGKRWVSFPGMPTGRHGLGAAAIGAALYAVGGGTRPGLSVSGINEVLYLEVQ